MHGRLSRPQPEPEREEATGGIAPSAAARVLDLQRAAGNAAVARAVLARDTGGGSLLTLPPRQPSSGLPSLVPGLNVASLYKPIPESVEAAITKWLETRRIGIGISAQQGSISMPEVVAQIRTAVPEAQQIAPYEIEIVVSRVLGPDTPPATRGKPTPMGTESEIAARIANALPKPPTSIKLSSSAGKLELSLSGIEAATKYGSAKVTAKAGKEGAEAKISDGKASATVSGSYKGDNVGLKTEVGPVAFTAKLEKENQTWSKWSMDLSVSLGGKVSARPPAAELTEAVEKANAAVTAVIAHLRAGGSPTDDVVKEHLGAIKPAIDAVSKATAAPKGPAAKVSVGASGGSSGWFAGVSLVVEF